VESREAEYLTMWFSICAGFVLVKGKFCFVPRVSLG
jgi:hypothetical protein